MLFNSLQFTIFLPIVFITYHLLPSKHQWSFLLISSCFFYMFFVPYYILILLIAIIIDYSAGLLISRAIGPIKKVYLIISVLSTCSLLFSFKYFNFFSGSFNNIVHIFGGNMALPMLNIILPIGLSFHTFQSLSYVIEVYIGRQQPEKNFGIYSLYVMFFPQLVAGPIERPQNLLHQFREKKIFDYNETVSGLLLFLWGIFKKMVIADRLAVVVNTVYATPGEYSGKLLLIANVFFALQIYADFSGYSDMARGLARMFGFTLMQNFNNPYFSKSISEFWRRWHISLSSWFKDYVYIPLGGKNVGRFHLLINLLITFTISGVWHGANWTFVFWGALNGILICIEKGILYFCSKWNIFKKPTLLFNLIRIMFTFFVILNTWIFFRAKSVADAFYIVTHQFQFNKNSHSIFSLGLDQVQFCIVIFAIGILLAGNYIGMKTNFLVVIRRLPLAGRWALYLILLTSFSIFAAFDLNHPFIYFQF